MKKTTIQRHLNRFASCLEYQTTSKEGEKKSGYFSFKLDVIGNKENKLYPYYCILSDIVNDSGTDTRHAYLWLNSALITLLEATQDLYIESIQEIEEFDFTQDIDEEVDIYTSDLTAWLASSNNNIYWLDEAVNQLEAKTNILGLAQYCAIQELFGSTREAVLTFLKDKEA